MTLLPRIASGVFLASCLIACGPQKWPADVRVRLSVEGESLVTPADCERWRDEVSDVALAHRLPKTVASMKKEPTLRDFYYSGGYRGIGESAFRIDVSCDPGRLEVRIRSVSEEQDKRIADAVIEALRREFESHEANFSVVSRQDA